MAAIWIVLGLVTLVLGGELLVRGASNLATMMKISPLVVGLTVVAFGTSAPELAVSIQAATTGSADLALGNVVGSNIFNVLFILGISALIVPLNVSRQLIQRDVPLMVGISLLLLVFSLDHRISPVEGVFLFLGIVVYTAICIWRGRSEPDSVEQSEPTKNRPKFVYSAHLLKIVTGLALLGVGSRWLIGGAVAIAEGFKVSELVIGLTMVAAGTSLPEVVTSIVAACRGQRDIAVGNVIGSNIFNILGVLGITSMASSGIAVSASALNFDIPVMLAASIACLPIFFTGNTIARWEGGLFFFYYLLYTVYVILAATGNGARETVRDATLFFLVPLTCITLAVAVARKYRQRVG